MESINLANTVFVLVVYGIGFSDDARVGHILCRFFT